MAGKILIFILLIMTALPARQLSLDIKFNTTALKQETEKKAKDSIKLTGETELEYYDQLLKQSMKTRAWTTYEPGKENFNLYINDRLQGINYTLLLELESRQTEKLKQILSGYLNGLDISYPVSFQKVKMFFKYRDDWYQKPDNQFVINLNDQDNQLQLIINKMVGETSRIDEEGNNYQVEHSYDPSFFYISRSTARELSQMISTKNIPSDK